MYNILPKTLFVGKTIQLMPSCHSTNDIASQLLQTTNPIEGTVIICKEQTAGKGQQGNKWEAEPGSNLTFSIILKPNIVATEQFSLNIITSLAVAETIQYYVPRHSVKIKWPNDIYINHKKASGILIQNIIKGNKIHSSVIGIGININQEKFIEPKAISICNILEKKISLEDILQLVLENLEKYYLKLKNNDKTLKVKYLENMYGIHSEKQFEVEDKIFSGRIEGVDELGRLLIQVGDKIEKYNAKEVKFLF